MSDDLSPEGESVDISVVVPLFDEQEGLAELHRRLTAVLGPQTASYEIVYVDDGSRDETPHRLVEIQDDDPNVSALFLSRNFGHQAAVTAGLDHARGRVVVVMDGDLQDPPELIPRMVRLWREGHEVVYAVRRRRREGPLKRLGYHTFYRVLRHLSDIDIPVDTGDFCLMDRKVVEALKALPERRRFVRGLRSFVGFRQVGIPYDRPARGAGTSKYPLRALFGLAMDGLVSFSGRPLRLVTCLGIASATLAAVLLVWVFLDAFRHHSAPRGWASTIVVVLFMGSVQLISLGIIGEYIRLIFLETKGRPPYLVRDYRPAAARAPSRVHSPALRGPHRPARAGLTPRAPGFPNGPA